jgi:plastocyanin
MMARTHRAASWAVAAGLLLAAAAAPTAATIHQAGRRHKASQSAGSPTVHTVIIDATRFQPATITIKAGDSIVWINKDMFPHTATSQAGGFDSGVLLAGKSWTHTFTKKGEVAYTCTLHPTMKGSVQVK